MPKYYAGSCELCHAIFVNLTMWQMIRMLFRHKHLLNAILHSNASFSEQSEELDLTDMFEVE